MSTLGPIERRVGDLEAETRNLVLVVRALSEDVARVPAAEEQLRRSLSAQADAMAALLGRLAALEGSQALVGDLHERLGTLEAAHAGEE